MCYFHHEKDSNASHSKLQAHTMDGIVLGRSPTSNAILVSNPRNQRYYEPDSYKINPYRLPSLVYPTIRYDGGRVFASLRMGGVAIDSALQVGFMLRALLSSYHGVVQDFRLGRHLLSTATLQTVVDQCVAYGKDPWKGPVDNTGEPVCTPSANAAGTSGNKANPYDAMVSC